jgi:hypothetical protein
MGEGQPDFPEPDFGLINIHIGRIYISVFLHRKVAETFAIWEMFVIAPFNIESRSNTLQIPKCLILLQLVYTKIPKLAHILKTSHYNLQDKSQLWNFCVTEL